MARWPESKRCEAATRGTTVSQSENTAFLGLGANIGDRLATLRAAVLALTEHAALSIDPTADVASLYETEPVGGPSDQPVFLNSVVRVRTSLSPRQLLELALSIEKGLGRVRGESCGPRTLDLDVLLFDDVVTEDGTLTLPHARMHERAFVLLPLSELAPDVRHPTLGLTVRELARRAALGGSVVLEPIHGPAWYPGM